MPSHFDDSSAYPSFEAYRPFRDQREVIVRRGPELNSAHYGLLRGTRIITVVCRPKSSVAAASGSLKASIWSMLCAA